MEWSEIVMRSKMGVIQIQLIRKKYWTIDGNLEDYTITHFRRDCLSLVFARLDELRRLERYEELEGVDLHIKSHLKPLGSLYRRYKELSDRDLIMTANHYPVNNFDRLIYISA